MEITSVQARIGVLEGQLEASEAALEACILELAERARALEAARAERERVRGQLDELRVHLGRLRAQDAGAAVAASEAAPVELPPQAAPQVELSKAQRQAQLEYSKLVCKSAFFDPQWYLQTYPDVKGTRSFAKAPHEHYLMYGGFEGRKPCAGFDSAFYLAQYPDVAAEGVNPLVHFLLFGQKEGRLAAPSAEAA